MHYHVRLIILSAFSIFIASDAIANPYFIGSRGKPSPKTSATSESSTSKTKKNLPKKEKKPTTKKRSKKQECYPLEYGSRVELGYRGPKGFGYDHGYGTLSAFLSPNGKRTFQPFIDLRGHVFDNGKWAANAGLGGRVSFDKVVLGLNAYYDYRDSDCLNGISQAGGGFELLSRWVELRVNGYVPFGSTTASKNDCFQCFKGNRIIINQELCAALPDVDAELGFYLPGPLTFFDTYIGVGPYYLFDKTVEQEKLGGEWGGRARISLQLYDGITAGGDVTYDPIFNTRGQGWIKLSLPLGPANLRKEGKRFKDRYPGPCDETARLYARMTQPVYRNEIIPIENKTRCCEINRPCSEASYNIHFVNNLAKGPGLGTFECPFNRLILAEEASCPGDIIYVFPGDNTTNGHNEGIVVQTEQFLVSSAFDFELDCIKIPALTPGIMPLICNESRVLDGADTQINAFRPIKILAHPNTHLSGFIVLSEDLVSSDMSTASGPGTADLVIFGPGTVQNMNFPTITGCGILVDTDLNGGTLTIRRNTFTGAPPFASCDAGTGIEFFKPLKNARVNIGSSFGKRNTFQNLQSGVVFKKSIDNSRIDCIRNNMTNMTGTGSCDVFGYDFRKTLTESTCTIDRNIMNTFNATGDIYGINFAAISDKKPTGCCQIEVKNSDFLNFTSQNEIFAINFNDKISNTCVRLNDNEFKNFSTTGGGDDIQGILFRDIIGSTITSNKNKFKDLTAGHDVFTYEMKGDITDSKLTFDKNTFCKLTAGPTENVSAFDINDKIINSKLIFTNSTFDNFNGDNRVIAIDFEDDVLNKSSILIEGNRFSNFTAQNYDVKGINFDDPIENSTVCILDNTFDNFKVVNEDLVKSQYISGIFFTRIKNNSCITIGRSNKTKNTFNNIGLDTIDTQTSAIAFVRYVIDSTVCIEHNEFTNLKSAGPLFDLSITDVNSGSHFNVLDNEFEKNCSIASTSATGCLNFKGNTNTGIYNFDGGTKLQIEVNDTLLPPCDAANLPALNPGSPFNFGTCNATSVANGTCDNCTCCDP